MQIKLKKCLSIEKRDFLKVSQLLLSLIVGCLSQAWSYLLAILKVFHLIFYKWNDLIPNLRITFSKGGGPHIVQNRLSVFFHGKDKVMKQWLGLFNGQRVGKLGIYV